MILQVKRAQRGDTGAFAALIEENKMALRRIAHGFFESEEDVADVLQETVLNAFEHLPELKNARYFKTWLVRILINNCNSLYRENRRSVPFDELPETLPAAPPSSGGISPPLPRWTPRSGRRISSLMAENSRSGRSVLCAVWRQACARLPCCLAAVRRSASPTL